jgi:error-prone DNA polymerase
MTDGREVVEDYCAVSLSLRAHPLALLRPDLERRGIRACADLARVKDGARVEIAGLVLIRQRPGKGNVTFITLEDETGIANVILWQRRFEEQRRVVMGAAMLGVKGVLQREGEVVHVIADRLEDLGGLLGSVGERQFPHLYDPADGARGAAPDPREKERADQESVIRVKSRNFH